MNLEEKNEIIVEKLRNLINNNPSLYQEIKKELGNVLPDLFLSKDEKTLNDIVNFLAKPSRQTITTLSGWADWLEDKKNALCHTEIFECAEKEKENFVSGFVVCTFSFDSFVEGEHYWFDYVGNDTYVGRSDNILNEVFYISPRKLFTFFSDLHEEVPADEIFDEAGPSDYRTLDEMVYPLTQKLAKEALEYVKEHHSSSELSDFQNAMNIAVAKAYDAGKNSNNKCFVDEETLKQNLSVLYSILPKCVDCQPRIIGDKDCIELQDFLKQLSEQLLEN